MASGLVATASGRRRRAAWLLPSLALHAGLLGFGAWRRAHHTVGAAPTAPTASSLDVEMLEEAPPLAPEPDPAFEEPPAPGRAPRTASRSALHASPLAGGSNTLEGEATATVTEAGEADSPAAPSPAGSAAPRLSMAQLGVGDRNPFMSPVDPEAARLEKVTRVQRRLDRALAQGLLSQDTASGRGAGGPVLRVLEATVYASNAPLNGQASFVFVIDGEGKISSTTLGAASGDREAWARVARKAAQALAQQKLSVPKGRGVRLTVAVSSRLELPSGADPGLAVDVLGLPVKRGAGPRSAKVDVLNPLAPLSPLSLMGDPADLGAKARRMVHARVVGEELL
jgi:hypothetical protein